MNNMKKFTTCCALLGTLLMSTAAWAETKVYDFVQAAEGSTVSPTWGEKVTSGGVALNLLATGDNTFDNRFAVGPTGRNDGTSNGFIFRTAGDWKGLWSQYDNRNFSILNLVKGNRVTITISKDAETLKFVDCDIVVSGETYTVAADGNMYCFDDEEALL